MIRCLRCIGGVMLGDPPDRSCINCGQPEPEVFVPIPELSAHDKGPPVKKKMRREPYRLPWRMGENGIPERIG